MPITVGSLHKQLAKLIEQGHARKPVTVDKDTFKHNLECDGSMILNVEPVRLEWILQADDDGGVKMNQDGSESGRYNLVLRGEHDYTNRT